MPRTAAADSTVTSSTTGGRLSVSLPKETAALVATLKDFFESRFEEQNGVSIEMKADQVIHAGLNELTKSIEAAKAKAESLVGADAPASDEK